MKQITNVISSISTNSPLTNGIAFMTEGNNEVRGIDIVLDLLQNVSNPIFQ